MKEIKYNTGDVLLTSGSGKLSKAIQDVEDCIWSHSGFIWICYGQTFVIESLKYGVAITPFKKYLESTDRLLLLKPDTYIDGSVFGSRLLPQIGNTPYGYATLISLFIYTKSKGKVWLGSGCGLICSQFIAMNFYDYFLKDDKGVLANMFKDWERFTPKKLFEMELFTKTLIK